MILRVTGFDSASGPIPGNLEHWAFPGITGTDSCASEATPLPLLRAFSQVPWRRPARATPTFREDGRCLPPPLQNHTRLAPQKRQIGRKTHPDTWKDHMSSLLTIVSRCTSFERSYNLSDIVRCLPPLGHALYAPLRAAALRCGLDCSREPVSPVVPAGVAGSTISWTRSLSAFASAKASISCSCGALLLNRSTHQNLW